MERFGVPERIVAFVLPTGYSFNLDGTTLYLSLATLFVAQLAGVSLGAGQQLLMMLTLMLASKGVAGVPRAALVVLTGTLTQFGLPLEGAAILLGIDQILDMGRTGVNVMGNCIATVVVARWEGVFDDERMRAFAAEDGGVMRIAVVGARGQLGAAMVAGLPRRATRRSPSTGRPSISPTVARCSTAVRRARPTPSSTAPATTRSTRPRRTRSRRCG